MKKLLLTTVAAMAVAGLSGMAAAQTMDSKGAAKPAGAAEEKAAPGGGAMQKPGAPTPATHADQGAKPDQRMGQEQKMTPQKGAQEEHGTPRKGAEQKGAEEERTTTQQKGAQSETTKPNVTDSSKTDIKQQNAGKAPSARGGNVQLSQDQRSKIHDIIGKSSSARVTTDVHFNIAVGVRVPRNVHVEVLPEDVVEVVPQYEGFDYVMVGDQILIIDPNTLEIVDILPA